jgi:hypothetical protein
MFVLGLDLVSGECFFVRVQVFPYLSSSSLFSFVNRLFGTWRIQGLRLFSRLYHPFYLVCSLCLERLGPKGECWHGIWPDGFCGVWGLTAPNGLRLRARGRWHTAPIGLACPHQPRWPPPASPAPMLSSRASPCSDAWHWSPDVILCFAEYALSFPIYICLSFSLFAL